MPNNCKTMAAGGSSSPSESSNDVSTRGGDPARPRLRRRMVSFDVVGFGSKYSFKTGQSALIPRTKWSCALFNPSTDIVEYGWY